MIDFHAFQQGGDNFLFFPRSARLYELSHPTGLLLSELTREGEKFAVSDISALFPADAPRDRLALFDELRTLFLKELEVPAPAPSGASCGSGSNQFESFSVYLAQSCNMSCSYCWNLGGSFGKTPRLMGRSKAREVTGLILSLARSSSAERIAINFYGGEPLLDFPALKSITLGLLRQQGSIGKSFQFSVDTNGVLLEGETAQFLASHFSQVGVSLDGREEIHDSLRRGKDGEPTWQRIVDNINAFPKPGLLGLRATLTPLSDSYLQTFRQLSQLRVRRIHLEYCHLPGYHENLRYQSLVVPQQRQLRELREFLDYYIDSISRYRSRGQIPCSSNLLDNLIRIRRGDRFTKPCGAGMNSIAINSRGEVFPCIAFVDRDNFTMGGVDAGSCLSLPEALAEFQVDSKSDCQACWLRYDCAGGCYATHYDRSGEPRQLNPVYCRNIKAKGELFLHAMAQMLKRCRWHLDS
jgi:uncharacterized protein